MRIFTLALAFVGCVTAPAPVAPDRAHQRAVLVHLGYAFRAAAVQCTKHAQWLGGKQFDFGAAQRADELALVCTRALEPVRDALYFASEAADPWSAEADAKIACAGRATELGLSRVRSAFVLGGVRVPELVDDGIELGAEIGARAKCDPLHPTTEVSVSYEESP